MKDKAIKDAMSSIENRIRHVYNQGYEDGTKANLSYEQGLNDANACESCKFRSKEPDEEPCKSCSHNYVDKYRAESEDKA